MGIPEYDLAPCREYGRHRITQRHAGRDCTANLTDEERAWENRGRSMVDNPIIIAIIEHVIDVQDGRTDPEDGLETERDVIERWIWYLAEGEHDVSWYHPILVQADAYLRVAARRHGLEHRPAVLEAVA